MIAINWAVPTTHEDLPVSARLWTRQALLVVGRKPGQHAWVGRYWSLPSRHVGPAEALGIAWLLSLSSRHVRQCLVYLIGGLVLFQCFTTFGDIHQFVRTHHTNSNFNSVHIFTKLCLIITAMQMLLIIHIINRYSHIAWHLVRQRLQLYFNFDVIHS